MYRSGYGSVNRCPGTDATMAPYPLGNGAIAVTNSSRSPDLDQLIVVENSGVFVPFGGVTFTLLPVVG